MEIQAAKELVIKAGKEVVASGLIARTWGNISCRIDDKQFVITPSGRAYEDLTPDEIVLVNMDDLSYDGDVKPSSEKGIHAEAYKLRPEVNFVIHTHQMQASVVSALGFDINAVPAKSAEVIGDNVPLASYGLPGTGKLRAGVVAAIQRSDSKAVIMAHHGALCMGESYEDAFAVAAELENVCAHFITNKYHEWTGAVAEGLETVYGYIADKFENKKLASAVKFDAYNSERDGSVFNISAVNGDGEIVRIDIKSGELVAGEDMPASAELHRAIYKKRKDVNAQLVGVTVKNAVFNPNNTLKTSKKVARALKGRNAVLLANNGALCVAGSEYDATAVEMVMEKGCKTEIGKKLFYSGKPINPIETHLMRFIYLQKYSKQAKK